MLPMLNIDDAKPALLEMLQTKSVFRGDFTLSSGAKSNYYIDCKLTTLDPEGIWLVGQLMHDLAAIPLFFVHAVSQPWLRRSHGH